MNRITRRHRRQRKAALRHGKKAKPTHKLKTGRTGNVHSKRTKTKKPLKMRVTINLIFPAAWWKV